MFWPEVLMAIAVLLVALAWYPCCCEGGVPAAVQCEHCSGTGNNAPYYMTIEVSGMGDDNNPDACADNLNGTFILESLGPTSCVWSKNNGAICTYWVSVWLLYAEEDSGDFFWKVKLEMQNIGSACFNDFYWESSTSETELSCLTTDEELTYTSEDIDDANCTVIELCRCDASLASIVVYSGDTT